jgi:hypothetical protein
MTAPSRAGIYFLRQGSDRVGALVVNPEPDESDLRRLTAEELRGRIRVRESVVASDDSGWRRAIFDVGSRRPLQPSLLLLALACLATELFVVRRDGQPRPARAA